MNHNINSKIELIITSTGYHLLLNHIKNDLSEEVIVRADVVAGNPLREILTLSNKVNHEDGSYSYEFIGHTVIEAKNNITGITIENNDKSNEVSFDMTEHTDDYHNIEFTGLVALPLF